MSYEQDMIDGGFMEDPRLVIKKRKSNPIHDVFKEIRSNQAYWRQKQIDGERRAAQLEWEYRNNAGMRHLLGKK